MSTQIENYFGSVIIPRCDAENIVNPEVHEMFSDFLDGLHPRIDDALLAKIHNLHEEYERTLDKDISFVNIPAQIVGSSGLGYTLEIKNWEIEHIDTSEDYKNVIAQVIEIHNQVFSN